MLKLIYLLSPHIIWCREWKNNNEVFHTMLFFLSQRIYYPTLLMYLFKSLLRIGMCTDHAIVRVEKRVGYSQKKLLIASLTECSCFQYREHNYFTPSAKLVLRFLGLGVTDLAVNDLNGFLPLPVKPFQSRGTTV